MSKRNVLYIPLDDRPVNLSFLRDFGEISGLNVITPPKELLGCFLEKGKCKDIAEWMKKNKGDVLIVSLDMLLYGGLVASRNPETEKEEAYNLLNYLKEFKIINPKVKIYAFSNIMRLSISISGDESEIWWRKINKYNELRYKVEILEDNTVGDELKKIISEIPEEVLSNYLESRKRNHIFNMEAVKLVKENIIDFLILSQEDCSPYGLHWIEHKIINDEVTSQSLNEKVFIYPGADEIGQILLARYINDESNFYPKVYVVYDNNEFSNRVAKFEDRPLSDNVNEHLKSLGIKIVDNKEESDFILAVTTPNIPYIDMAEDDMKNYNKNELTKQFVKKIKGYIEEKQVVALADLTCSNGGDSFLIDSLKKENILLSLAAYSAWNTAGNALGTAIVHGNILSNLIYKKELTKDSCDKSLKFLLERYVDDYIYQSVARKETINVVKDENLCIFNMGRTSDEVNSFVENSLTDKANNLFENSKVNYLDLKGRVKVLNITALLPWNRTFEVDCSVCAIFQEALNDN